MNCETIEVVPGPDGQGIEIPCKRTATKHDPRTNLYVCSECAVEYADDEGKFEDLPSRDEDDTALEDAERDWSRG